jgi:membrane-bound acyltransferase YfiQ involved in biofilm formation
MKKIIGIICIGILVLNIIGMIYLVTTNPDKLENNSYHFVKKIGGAFVFGAVGFYLLKSSANNSKTGKDEK